ncbi:MAG: elongation factor 1-beta [Thermoplasmata archaeon]|nr:elongation factor 1-beta [Thermoplasmata archaeon]NIS13282.1 elongation factor 1-beta [Thermoplasmata archaeon]NIS21177.1 elongation factor 1-beta [Thermoplasmata archaeon]NIT78664.1 elongation factor 1-beta [Thermoplasmata archaeon]NIU50235.1 elongation factor 1-beta [Thermoplasmata archaeon]
MGTAAIKYRVMPEGVEVDLDALKARITTTVAEAGAELYGIDVVPFAFGLKALETTVMVEDKVGGGIPDAVEEALGALDGVQSVEMLEMGLI